MARDYGSWGQEIPPNPRRGRTKYGSPGAFKLFLIQTCAMVILVLGPKCAHAFCPPNCTTDSKCSNHDRLLTD